MDPKDKNADATTKDAGDLSEVIKTQFKSLSDIVEGVKAKSETDIKNIKDEVAAFCEKYEGTAEEIKTNLDTLTAKINRPGDISKVETDNTGGFKSIAHFVSDVFYDAKTKRPTEIFNQYVEKAHEIETKLRKLNEQKVPSGFAETYEDDGGILVPVEFRTRLMQRRNEISSILSRLQNFGPITGTKVVIPAIDDASRKTGSRYGGVTTGWLDEAQIIPPTKGKFRRVTMEVNKIGAMFHVTSEMLSDSFAAIERIFMDIVMKEVAWRIEDAVFSGNGIAKPRGIIGHPAAISVDLVTNQSSSEPVVAQNIIDMWSHMPPEYISEAAWVMNHELFPEMMKFAIVTGMSGTPVYMPPGGLTDAPYGTLLGKPIILSEHCKAKGEVGDIFFVNFSQVGYVDKGDPDTASSIHLKFDTDETTFRVTQRLDAQPMWETSLTPANATAGFKLSPYITLKKRNA